MAYEHFDEAISDNFCPMQLDQSTLDPNFAGNFGTRALSRTSLSVVTSDALEVRRDKQHIGLTSDAFFLLKIQLKGVGVFRQRNREAVLQPGDFTLCSTTEPYELLLPQAYSQAVLSIPQSLLHDMIPNAERLLAKHQLGDMAANSVFVSLVGAMINRADELAVHTAARLESHILDMLITTLESNIDQQPGVQHEHLFRIKKFIAAHLRDPQLNPQKIAAALGVSKRHLHLMFEEEEATLARYILEQRLEACYQCIANPHYQTMTVSEIAFEHGFNDAAHFSRSFKKRFSISPSKVRH
jgi:AraC-like DNA-binding protein